MKFSKTIFASFSLISFFLITLGGNAYTQEGDLLIYNVNVVDVKKGRVYESQDVLIKGERIKKISSKPDKLNGASAIDGSGKYLIPGLWDMHTHNFWDNHFSNYYVANGVVGLRNMYTSMEFISPLKDSINNGLIPGPYYVAAGRVVDGSNPDFPDWLAADSIGDLAGILDTLVSEGSDFVKVYDKISEEVYYKLIKEARKRKLNVEGHVPRAVSAIDAAKAGQKSIEHLFGLPELTTDKLLFRKFKTGSWATAIMDSDDLGNLVIDEALAFENFKTLRKKKTFVCPTLSVWNNYFHPNVKYETDGIYEKFPEDVHRFWTEELEKYRDKTPGENQMMLKKYHSLQRITSLLYRAGVSMMVGTDAINPCVYPGFSIHTEMQLLYECGIPEAQILKMATLIPASFLDLTKDFGTIEKKKYASMVLLNANPLEDISNTSRIESVFLKGKYFDKEALDKMKE